MADLGGLLQTLIGGGAGAGLIAVGRFIEKRVSVSDSAKDQTIAVLTAENDRLRAERDSLGRRHDAIAAQLEKERLQALGVYLRGKEDPATDDALVEDMPTAVRDRAAIVSPKTKSLPPEIKDALTTYNNDMTVTPKEPLGRK